MGSFRSITPRVPVADIGRTTDFYCRTLGFAVDLLWPEDQPSFAIVRRDNVQLAFYTADGHRPVKATGQAELYIEMAGVTQWHQHLRGQVPTEWGPEVYSYGRREFAIRDPDGYLLIFSEPCDDPPTCIVE